MTTKRRVLFLCTGNSCRSQMAEAILRHAGGNHFEALSAGSHPAGFVHALSLEALSQMHIPSDGLISKSWDEFEGEPIDVVVTVCDNAAGEVCPVWGGTPLTPHWSMPDPAYHVGTDAERIEFALRVAERLRTKILAMIDLDWTATREELKERLDFLGEI